MTVHLKKSQRLEAEIKTLRRQKKELEAQLAHAYHFAVVQMDKAGKKALAASGVMVELNVLGGREVCGPFVIRGGLSDATIEALKADCRESYATAVEFKP